MNYIRNAKIDDISRIAEILVFNKRLNFYPIFKNDEYSFGELQVISIANEYLNNIEKLENIWVFDDGIVKALIEIENTQIKTFYVDSFFQSQGIGAQMIEFAIEKRNCDYLWALEKNVRAISFYEKHGFVPSGEKMFEEGTTEYLLKLKRK